ncbi:DNA-methyltransferase [Paenibacillus polymyxa]|uniref:DNA-methyltransferase n=1 Tax=Paenibacillus polymyxa TaxID=1406 RepID=UPI0039BC996B
MNKEFSDSIELNRIYQMDCLEGMKLLHDKSVDMILCDLPYGTTQNKWDSVIDLELLWIQYRRVIKENGVIVLTAQTPFDKVLGSSNLKMLKYEWIWEKTTATGHLNAKKMPMKAHENILVFYKNLPTYNPQKTTGHAPVHSYTKHQEDGSNYGKTKVGVSGGGSTERYPRSVQVFATDKQKEAYHPTQKPVALFEYLIKTYTNEGDIVLDNCIGSGTTAVAAIRNKREFIGFETESKYIEVANMRIKSL